MRNSAHRKLEALARLEAFPCVTISLPVSGEGRASRQDSVRLDNALRLARERLALAGQTPEEAAELLLPAARLVDDARFWAAPEGGVSLHVAPGFFHVLRTDFALPERVTVGARFAIAPLLPLLDEVERLYVLALSRNRVRLVEGEASAARELALPGLPRDFEAAVGRLQYYSEVTAHTASAAALGRRGALFHGHGDGDEEHFDADLESFCRRVASALAQGLPDPATPLVLAAVGEYVPMFRKAAGRLALAEPAIVGNPDLASELELVDAGREILRKEARETIAREVARWTELGGGGRAARELEGIIRGADAGHVETLFVAADAERWGSYEADLRRVTLRAAGEPGDEELLDLAAARTLAHGGSVHALPRSEMPENRDAVAILRFAARD
jgi:hypothetical protein